MLTPWICQKKHRLEISDVDEEGNCTKCGTPVHHDTSPREVREAMKRDRVKPVKRVLIKGRFHQVLQRECEQCCLIYETPYANSRYCTDMCKKQSSRRREKERRTGRVFCLFCAQSVDSQDKRRKFCDTRCREDMRRGSSDK